MRLAALPLLALLAGCGGHQLTTCPTGPALALNGPGLAPSVWDDGNSTFLQFPGNTPIPVVLTVDAQGHESPAPITVSQGGLVTVQKVAPEIRLRDGDRLACLVNRGFNPVGNPPGTGTTRADVVRELRVP